MDFEVMNWELCKLELRILEDCIAHFGGLDCGFWKVEIRLRIFEHWIEGFV